jgi:hypothetical protein
LPSLRSCRRNRVRQSAKPPQAGTNLLVEAVAALAVDHPGRRAFREFFQSFALRGTVPLQQPATRGVSQWLPLRPRHSFAICFVASIHEIRFSWRYAVESAAAKKGRPTRLDPIDSRQLCAANAAPSKEGHPIGSRPLVAIIPGGRPRPSHDAEQHGGFSVMFNAPRFLINITTCFRVAMCWGQPAVGLRPPSGCPQHITTLRQLAQSDLKVLAFK